MVGTTMGQENLNEGSVKDNKGPGLDKHGRVQMGVVSQSCDDGKVGTFPQLTFNTNGYVGSVQRDMLSINR